MIRRAPDIPTSPPRAKPTLVLGLGNTLLGDEGIGVRVVEALQRESLPPDVELIDGGTPGMDLLDTLADRQSLIVIDAIEADVPPGTVLRLSPEDLIPAAGQTLSVHDVGWLEALSAAAQLGVAPRRVTILGVKPYEVCWNLGLTPGMRRMVPVLTGEVLRELERNDCV